MEQSSGHARFSSELGRGTTFRIYFPRLAAQPQDQPPVASQAHVARGTEVVLIAEDEDRLRRLIHTFLEGRGYTVLEAKDGAEGLDLCQSHQGPIHLLITDVVMPRMGGRELAERVAPQRPGMKVLFVSGYGEDTLLQDIVGTGRHVFLRKPFTLEELARAVRALFD